MKETRGHYMEMIQKKNWISDAIKHPGALKSTAASEHALNPNGTIKKTWEKEKSKGTGVTAKRARLALTLKKMRHENITSQLIMKLLDELQQ